MTKIKATNGNYLKKYNQKNILNLIRLNKSISRADLSKATGLSPTAVSILVSNLLNKKYIKETGIGESSGGRRPILLELATDTFYSIGVDIDIDFIDIIVIDISGAIITQYSAHIFLPSEFSKVMEIVDEKIILLLNEKGIEKEAVLGIGISVPGIVHGKTRKILLAPNLGWQNINVNAHLNSIFDTKVYLENESNTSAICENWMGCCQNVNNFVCLNIKSGIGAGIYIDGKLYRGANGVAGEVGHIQVDDDGPLCGCGNYGCLSVIASTPGIIEKAKKLVRQGIVSKLNDYNIDDINLNLIAELAVNGDEAAKNILLEAARYLAKGMTILINTYNPEKIVLGKDFTVYSDLVIDYINNILKTKVLKIDALKYDISVSSFGENSSTLGAAIIPLMRLFFTEIAL